ncbi:phenylacetate--CoA ligase family protein [Amycolatopsis rhabdoformis]|uniref:Phenylacetate--CoA ligase family protein n=1 Tax=Amycolatopsis rhabdoformis TaxID=1448059 RepID=A0ABZ1I6B1_9PSEU|nr:phenylacetate--CoA ligase family protein [Amycolatopsis rhabdoformis]WSE29246.1 phenylacetate--CoA ligase family protein [Amycolatopsis rhabdoformis]
MRPDDVIKAYQAFFAGDRRPLDVLGFFREVVATVPAYRKFLDTQGIDPAGVTTLADFRRLPLTSKAAYQSQYPLPELCREGRLDACDMIAVSSGSSGTPTIWPRSLADELHVAERFEQVFRTFEADTRTTLAVVCFPLGTWVGGLFTAACVRHLAAKGFPITTVAPGNNKAEILRVLPELAPHFDQVVLLGYPPFVKDVVDSGTGWAEHSVKMVFAGEVFSEEWRDLVAQRAGVADPVSGMVSLYGTADAGVLGTETPKSVSIRRFLAARPALARELFGESRLPTLVQYDPASRFFEADNGTLLFSGDNGVPLVRYHIADEGGVLAHAELLEFCARNGFTPADGPDLPFVYLFGRSLFTVSFFGANIYPENVTVGLEQPQVSGWVTGKFVLETYEDADRDRRLRITVELAPGHAGDAEVLATSIRDQLLRLNSEFAHYVPAERQLPEVVLRPAGDPEYFPVGVKHRYTRGT